MKRLLQAAIAAALVGATFGCTSYRPIAPLPAPATQVRVSFLSPRDIVARTATGDSVVLTGVRQLNGSIVRAQLDTRTDSVRVRLGSARSESGAIEGIPEGAIVSVPRVAFVRVDQKSFDPVKTFKVAGYVAAGVLIIGLLAIGLALDENSY